jgi:transposase
MAVVRWVSSLPGFNPLLSALIHDMMSTMFKAFVFRLYPSKNQRARLGAVRETCRHFYNDCLRQRKDAYELHGVTITRTEQLRRVKVEKDTSPYAADIHSHILQVVVADLDKSFQAFFRRVKAGEKPGYPRFKGRTDSRVLDTRNSATASRSMAGD